MTDPIRTRVLIIGSGPAGYTAAIYAARANLAPLQILGLEPGGQLMITNDVENYPGFAQAVTGPALMEQMKGQAEHVGTTMVHDLVVSLDLSRRPFVAVADSGQRYEAETVILCTGAQARWLGVPGEQQLRGQGVSACATCDGFFFRGRDVVVVGGGNTAVEEALFLANIAKSVTLVHRRDRLRAEKIQQDRLFRHEKVRIVWDHVVDQILGDANGAGVTAVRLKHAQTGVAQDLPTDGVFVAIGHDPANALVKGQVVLDRDGYVVTAPDSTQTSVPGVFAAGDVRDKIYRQAVTAAGMGCMAALEADRFLAAAEAGQTPEWMGPSLLVQEAVDAAHGHGHAAGAAETDPADRAVAAA